ncbi:MAG: hypothetical protein PHT32_07910, partial [Candidatus Omnitrophica bacterium]|nr:hypothetical protein [Candidatus Omnitrophota bacterium]
VPGPIGHINPYSYKTIRRLAQTSRLEVLSQALANISYRMYEYQYGRKAALRYLPKEALLRVMPVMAARFFGYNCYLLCRSLA